MEEEMMAGEILCNVPMMLLLTVGAYLLGLWVKKKSGLSLMHPFIISIPVIIAVIKSLGISPDYYVKSNFIIDFMLGPCVVSLGYLLYRHRRTVREHIVGIMSAVVTGSITGVVSVYLLCPLLGLDEMFIRSLEAKSVTSPIAMDITRSIGGDASLAVVSVILSGFIGAVIGPAVMKFLRIKDPVARGLAMGCSSHGLGTARAIELGAVEGAVSGLSIALMGVLTSLIVPLFNLLVGF
jgi:predicted murein hydrolase (TIGR00659 family)